MSCPYVGCVPPTCGDVPIIVWSGVAPLFHAPSWSCSAPSTLALLDGRALDDPLLVLVPISPRHRWQVNPLRYRRVLEH